MSAGIVATCTIDCIICFSQPSNSFVWAYASSPSGYCADPTRSLIVAARVMQWKLLDERMANLRGKQLVVHIFSLPSSRPVPPLFFPSLYITQLINALLNCCCWRLNLNQMGWGIVFFVICSKAFFCWRDVKTSMQVYHKYILIGSYFKKINLCIDWKCMKRSEDL